MVQLNDRLLSLLDGEAARLGVSRSALIREVLEERLHDAYAARIAGEIVAGYKRVPPGTPDEWGDLEAVTDRTAADLLHRLDAEEASAGHEPW